MHMANQVCATLPRASGAPARRRATSPSLGTRTPVSRSRPDAEPRMPSASNPGSRSTPGAARSTRRWTIGAASRSAGWSGAASSASRALTTACVSAGSHVVHVFSPSRTNAPPSSRALVDGRPPRAGLPLPSSVDAEFTRPPASTAARSDDQCRLRPRARVSRSADDLRVHREPERRRTVDAADRGQHLDRVRRGRVQAALGRGQRHEVESGLDHRSSGRLGERLLGRRLDDRLQGRRGPREPRSKIRWAVGRGHRRMLRPLLPSVPCLAPRVDPARHAPAPCRRRWRLPLSSSWLRSLRPAAPRRHRASRPDRARAPPPVRRPRRRLPARSGRWRAGRWAPPSVSA